MRSPQDVAAVKFRRLLLIIAWTTVDKGLLLLQNLDQGRVAGANLMPRNFCNAPDFCSLPMIKL